jgi:hypothetical protein
MTENGVMSKMDKYDDGVKVKFKFNPPPEITN